VQTGESDYLAEVTGEISADDDRDWDFFLVYARPGDTLVVDLSSDYEPAGGVSAASFGEDLGLPPADNGGTEPLPDTYLWLYDADGNLLDENDDWNDLFSHIEYTVSGEGGPAPFFIVADAYDGDGYVGSYTLTVTLTSSESPVTTLQPDEDFYRVRGLATDELAVAVVAPGADPGQLTNICSPRSKSSDSNRTAANREVPERTPSGFQPPRRTAASIC
jgi:hypothetical protein